MASVWLCEHFNILDLNKFYLIKASSTIQNAIKFGSLYAQNTAATHIMQSSLSELSKLVSGKVYM